jgi:hypothetical protein
MVQAQRGSFKRCYIFASSAICSVTARTRLLNIVRGRNTWRRWRNGCYQVFAMSVICSATARKCSLTIVLGISIRRSSMAWDVKEQDLRIIAHPQDRPKLSIHLPGVAYSIRQYLCSKIYILQFAVPEYISFISS